MKNLIKINLLLFFDIHKLFNAKTKEEFAKNLIKMLSFLACFVVLGVSIYYYFDFIFEGYLTLKIPYIILAQSFAIVSSMLLLTNIYKINGLLFNNKDYNLVLSLPVKRITYIISKLISLYLSNIIYSLLIMIPPLILYIKNVNVDAIFYILYFISFFIIPLIPIVIATIIGTIISSISSKFKFKNLINILLTIALFTLILFISMKLETMPKIDIANMGKSIIDIFNNIYPLTNLYVNIIKDYNIQSLFIFIFIPLLIFIIYIFIINKFYTRINNNLEKEYTNKKYKLIIKKGNTPLIALYKKEIARYFSSSNYVMNTMIGSIMLIISIIIYIFVGKDKLDIMLGIKGLSQAISDYTPIVLGCFMLLTCTTHPSISLEGKQAWIMKTIPVSPIKIFLSKIMVNLTISIPFLIVSAILLKIYLRLSINTFILMLVIPTLYSTFISMFGVIINMCFVNFEWKNEITIIKQSLPAFISILFPMLLAVLPFVIEHNLSISQLNILIIIIAILLNIICFIILNTISKKQFQKLNC